MAQNSFAFLFVLVLGAAGCSLLWSLRESWAQVRAALSGKAPGEAPPQAYTTRVAPAAEVPWVARRLVLRELDEDLPPIPAAFSAWAAPQLPRPAGRQLAFGFGDRAAA